jgi:Fic family protein
LHNSCTHRFLVFHDIRRVDAHGLLVDIHRRRDVRVTQNLLNDLHPRRDRFDGKLTTEKWAKLVKVSHDTALRDIQDLIEKGILRQEDSGGLSMAYTLVYQDARRPR